MADVKGMDEALGSVAQRIRTELGRMWDSGFAAGVAAERAAFTPPPSDEERADGWQISTAWLEAVCEAMHTPDGERCSWEQIECVLLRAAAIRAGGVRG